MLQASWTGPLREGEGSPSPRGGDGGSKGSARNVVAPPTDLSGQGRPANSCETPTLSRFHMEQENLTLLRLEQQWQGSGEGRGLLGES